MTSQGTVATVCCPQPAWWPQLATTRLRLTTEQLRYCFLPLAVNTRSQQKHDGVSKNLQYLHFMIRFGMQSTLYKCPAVCFLCAVVALIVFSIQLLYVIEWLFCIPEAVLWDCCSFNYSLILKDQTFQPSNSPAFHYSCAHTHTQTYICFRAHSCWHGHMPLTLSFWICECNFSVIAK